MLSTECSPLCPFRAFKCTKNALVIRRRRDRLETICDWTGDRCIGWRCQFAVCMRHALLPEGTCSLMAEKKERKPSIDEEALRVKSQYTDIGRKLKKRGLDVEGEV